MLNRRWVLRAGATRYIKSLIRFAVRVVLLIMTDGSSASRYHCAGILSRIDGLDWNYSEGILSLLSTSRSLTGTVSFRRGLTRCGLTRDVGMHGICTRLAVLSCVQSLPKLPCNQSAATSNPGILCLPWSCSKRTS